MIGCDACSRDEHPCWQCGEPVEHSESFCSDWCERKYEQQLR